MRYVDRGRAIACGVILLLFSALLVAPARPASAAAAPPCPDLYMIGTRGSGQRNAAQDPVEAGLGPEVAQFRDEFIAQRPANVTFDFEANPYRAVPVTRKGEDNGGVWLFNLAGAVTGRDIGEYHKSVAEGVSWLVDEVRQIINVCASTQLLLVGHSQGAQVTANAYQQLTATEMAHVYGVVLFGDPRFNGSDFAANAGSYSPRRNGSVRERGADEVARPVFLPASNGRVLSYCHANDIVCQGAFSFNAKGFLTGHLWSEHINYTTFGDSCGTQTYPRRAAGYFAYRAGNHQASSGPVAVLTPVEDAAHGTQVRISAASSCDPASRPLNYRWDLDGSGVYATDTGNIPGVNTSFSADGAHQVSVRVTNDQGQASTATTTVNVGDAGVYTDAPAAPVNLVSAPAEDGGSVTLSWSDAATGPPAEAYELYTTDGDPLEDFSPGSAKSVVIPERLLPLEVEVVAENRVGQSPHSKPITLYPVWPPTQPGSSAACGQLNSLFNAYGDQGGHWTGADSTVSVPLPDGRTAWLFSDTFLGTVNADHSRPRSAPFIHNSMVVQSGTTLTTLTGGTTAAPKSLVGAATDTQPGDLGWWVGDGKVNGNTLQVFYHHYKSGGSDALNLVPQGTGIATFALPSLALQSLVPLDTRPQIDWGAALVDGNDGYTYIYGVEGAPQAHFLHIARAVNGSLLGPAGAPTSAWTFWTGNPNAGANGWSTDENDAARVMTGVGNGFSVKYLNGRYTLVTVDSDRPFSNSVFAYFATSPTGPFARQTWLYNAPEAQGSHIVYDARLHPEQTCNGSNVVLSYNVNSLDNADNYADARLYRPKFIVATLPGAPDVSKLPGPPTDLTATLDDDAQVHLSWTAPTGPNTTNLTYQVYQRKSSTGQAQFTPVPTAPNPAATSAVVGLVDGGVYDYRVAARNSAGEGPPSQLAELEVELPAPTAAPTNLAAHGVANGDIALSWTGVGGAGWISYHVYQKDLTASDVDFAPAVTGGATAVGATVTGLTPGHTYQFTVDAANSGGEGPRSAPVTATSTVAPPTNVTAQAVGDGRINVAWTGPGAEFWYWIYYHDDTDDPQNSKPYTRTAYPVTTGTSFAMSYLTGGHTYSFYVTSVSGHGESVPSNHATATAARPIAPHLSAVARNDGGIDLSWTAPSPDYWYWISFHDDTADPSGGAGFTRIDIPSTKTTFTHTPLYIGHTYSYYVTSISYGSATSVPSNRVSATAFLPPPGGLTAFAGDGKVLLRWSAPLPGQWYWIYMREPGHTDYTRMPLPVANSTTLTVAPLANNQTYSFYATTIGPGGGESGWSNVVTATPLPTPPNAPTNVSATAGNDGSITVRWTGTSPNDWYWVYVHDDTADPSGSVAFAHGPYPVTSGTSLNVQGLRSGHAYSFFVTTISSVNGTESGRSDVVRAVSYLAPPTNLNASTNADGSVTLSWTASAGDVDYYWVYQQEPGGSYRRLPYPIHNQTAFVASGLRTGQRYWFYVTAAGSADSESGGSNPVSIVPQLAHPNNLTASVDGWGTVALRWSPPFAGALYWIYLHDDTADPGHSQPYTRLAYPTGATSFSIGDGLTGDHTYAFYITTAYAGNESGPSNVVAPSRKIAAPTGLRGRTDVLSSGSGQCESAGGPDCRIHLSWNGVEGAHHYDVYRLLVSADELIYQYLGTSYDTTFNMTVGALAQYRASYQVVAMRWYGGQSAPSIPVTLTIGDYGGYGTDCYVLAHVPTLSGSTVHSAGSAVCPRSTPIAEIIFTYSVIDNTAQTNTRQTTCPGTAVSCSSQATAGLRGGTHTYCTGAEIHIVTSVSNNSADGLATRSYSRCVRLTG